MPYATPTEVRARYSALADTAAYPDALLTALVSEFEGIAERYKGIAYNPRTITETFTVSPGAYRTDLELAWPEVTAVSAFTLGGSAVTPYTIDQAAGRLVGLILYGGFTGGVVSVTYTHGLTVPPAAIVRACLIYTRSTAKADTSGTTLDVLSQNVDGATTRYATPDWEAGRPTGFREVDRLLNSVANEAFGFA